MKLNSKFQLNSIRPYTPKSNIDSTKLDNGLCITVDYKPHSFSQSDQVLKAGNELKQLHRRLFSARPKRQQLKEFLFDKETNSLDLGFTHLEITQPKMKISLNPDYAQTNGETKEKCIQTMTFYQIETPKQNLKQPNPKKIILKTKYRRYLSISNDKSTLKIRDLNSFTIENNKIRKYDFSSIRVQTKFNSINY